MRLLHLGEFSKFFSAALLDRLEMPRAGMGWDPGIFSHLPPRDEVTLRTAFLPLLGGLQLASRLMLSFISQEFGLGAWLIPPGWNSPRGRWQKEPPGVSGGEGAVTTSAWEIPWFLLPALVFHESSSARLLECHRVLHQRLSPSRVVLSPPGDDDQPSGSKILPFPIFSRPSCSSGPLCWPERSQISSRISGHRIHIPLLSRFTPVSRLAAVLIQRAGTGEAAAWNPSAPFSHRQGWKTTAPEADALLGQRKKKSTKIGSTSGRSPVEVLPLLISFFG